MPCMLASASSEFHISNLSKTLLLGFYQAPLDVNTLLLCCRHSTGFQFVLELILKLLSFVFNAINNLAPSYLSEILTIRNHGRALRSSGQVLLEVPRTRLKQWGDRSFAVAAPRLWNSLLPDIRTTTDLSLLKSKLKTHFFRLAFNSD